VGGGIDMHDGKMSETLQHATTKLQHSYPAPPERVFSEFADPVERARWSAPSNEALIYDETDFRLGGKDVFRCGPKWFGIEDGLITPSLFFHSTLEFFENRKCASMSLAPFWPIVVGNNRVCR
jgi:hypothetical protein